MNWLPNDLPSFLWGMLVALAGLIASGFLKEAGKDFWVHLKKKLFPPPPPPPEDVQVDLRFEPTMYKPRDCLWARHESVSRYQAEGYTFYPHPSNGGRCIRGYGREQSYLMVKPNEVRGQ